MRTQKPVNQKSVYHSYAEVYDKLMNKEIEVDRGEAAAHCLDGMCRAYALEIKRADFENSLKGNSRKVEIRTIEIKNFENIPIEETSEDRKEEVPIQ